MKRINGTPGRAPLGHAWRLRGAMTTPARMGFLASASRSRYAHASAGNKAGCEDRPHTQACIEAGTRSGAPGTADPNAANPCSLGVCQKPRFGCVPVGWLTGFEPAISRSTIGPEHPVEQTPNPYAISILASSKAFAKRIVPSRVFAGERGILGAKTVENGSSGRRPLSAPWRPVSSPPTYFRRGADLVCDCTWVPSLLPAK
jgi:hypothetical protein